MAACRSEGGSRPNMTWWFEDYEAAGAGHRWTSPTQTISEDDIARFARLTGDTHPQHLDAAYGASSGYGACIAHGFLTISVASGLVYRIGLDEGSSHAILTTWWRLLAPVYAGDSIHVAVSLTGCRRSQSHPALGIVKRRYEVVKQDDQVVAAGRLVLLCKCRDGRAMT